MLKIEYRDKENSRGNNEKYVIVNGVEDEKSSYSDFIYPTVFLYNSRVVEILCSYSFKDVGKELVDINFGIDYGWWDESINVIITCNETKTKISPSIIINIGIQTWEEWAKPWSISSLAKEFKKNVEILNNDSIKYWQGDEDPIIDDFGVEYFSKNDSLVIQSELDFIISIVKDLALKTNDNLLLSLDNNIVTTLFQFPKEIATASKQYLVYFAQFLADIGIEADAEIKEETNHTLFKVIPKNKEESLEQIRQALAVYLDMPSNSDLVVQELPQNNIAINQLQANIFHLKSQMLLISSTIQALFKQKMQLLKHYSFRIININS